MIIGAFKTPYCGETEYVLIESGRFDGMDRYVIKFIANVIENKRLWKFNDMTVYENKYEIHEYHVDLAVGEIMKNLEIWKNVV